MVSLCWQQPTRLLSVVCVVFREGCVWCVGIVRTVGICREGREQPELLEDNGDNGDGHRLLVQRGTRVSCERGCTRDDYGKAGPFSVVRLKMDLPFVNFVCVQTSTQRSAGPLVGWQSLETGLLLRGCHSTSCSHQPATIGSQWPSVSVGASLLRGAKQASRRKGEQTQRKGSGGGGAQGARPSGAGCTEFGPPDRSRLPPRPRPPSCLRRRRKANGRSHFRGPLEDTVSAAPNGFGSGTNREFRER